MSFTKKTASISSPFVVDQFKTMQRLTYVVELAKKKELGKHSGEIEEKLTLVVATIDKYFANICDSMAMMCDTQTRIFSTELPVPSNLAESITIPLLAALRDPNQK